MKASFFSVLALPTFFLGAVAAPSEVPETAVVEKRQVGDAYSIVESLYSEIQQYTFPTQTRRQPASTRTHL